MVKTVRLLSVAIALVFTGCGGPAGIMTLAGMHAASAAAGLGTQTLLGNIFYGQAAAGQQIRVECRQIDGKEYCREVPRVSVEVVTSPPPSTSGSASQKTIEPNSKYKDECDWYKKDGEWKCNQKKPPKKPMAMR